MNRNQPTIVLLGLLLVGAASTAATFGGWAVTTVQELPDYAVVGKPLTLTFEVRQHGRDLLKGLKPEIEAQSGKTELRAMALPGKTTGQFVSTITLPSAGAWTITINSGFMNSGVTLLPIPAIEAGARAVALSDADRGHRLFLAKGCITCHGQIAVGPDLASKQFPAEYVKQLLADPKGTFGNRRGAQEMPNLNLKPLEIAALAAYVGSAKQSAAR